MYNYIRRRIVKLINTLQPTQMMVLGFAMVILIGAFLLNLPIASQGGKSVGEINALFTATSAVCVTGLIAVDTATHWTTFGQVVIITLIQIGGLGFMTIATLFALIAKKKINLKERLLIQESLNQFDLSGLVKLTRHVLMITFVIEGLGALVLSTQFVPEFGFGKGVWYSVFHSISAFCNAGFDLMGTVSGPFTSLTSYVNNFTVSATICSLILLGGLGFPVILDIIKVQKFKKLAIHSKIVLVTTAIVTAISVVVIFIVEFNNPETMGSLSFGNKMLASIFQSVTARTAGFNTIDLSLMHQGGIFVIIVLMFIGASPASTGGGIKTTTVATVALCVKSSVLGKEDVEVYGRRLDMSVVKKSMGIFFIAVTTVSLGTLLISITEPHFSLVDAWFEVMSALTTAGLSIGGSPSLSLVGKIIIMCYMFMGRVGSLTLVMALTAKTAKSKNTHIRYPEGKILVG